MTQIDLNKLSDKELLDLAQSLNVLDTKKKYCLQEFIYPHYLKTPGYKKHLLFFKAGAVYKERALIAANRTGKTYTAATEVSFHLNGRYPEGWEGKVFNEPVNWWEVGKTHDTTRDILQKYLIGNVYDPGTGMIPKKDIVKMTTKPGVPGAIQEVYVKHYDKDGKQDGISCCGFKSYIQGIDAFMGTSQHGIHLDEEPGDRGIYTECCMRTMTTNGIILCTFTPLLGLSEVVLSFLPGGKFPPGGIGECIRNDN